LVFLSSLNTANAFVIHLLETGFLLHNKKSPLIGGSIIDWGTRITRATALAPHYTGQVIPVYGVANVISGLFPSFQYPSGLSVAFLSIFHHSHL